MGLHTCLLGLIDWRHERLSVPKHQYLSRQRQAAVSWHHGYNQKCTQNNIQLQLNRADVTKFNVRHGICLRCWDRKDESIRSWRAINMARGMHCHNFYCDNGPHGVNTGDKISPKIPWSISSGYWHSFAAVMHLGELCLPKHKLLPWAICSSVIKAFSTSVLKASHAMQYLRRTERNHRALMDLPW